MLVSLPHISENIKILIIIEKKNVKIQYINIHYTYLMLRTRKNLIKLCCNRLEIWLDSNFLFVYKFHYLIVVQLIKFTTKRLNRKRVFGSCRSEEA